MTLFLLEYTFLFSPCIYLYYANVSEIYFHLLTYLLTYLLASLKEKILSLFSKSILHFVDILKLIIDN